MIVQNEPPNLFYRGSSMKGTFKPGDRLFIEEVSFKQIRRGDLIVFTYTRHGICDFVVHRVRNIKANTLIMRGDNSRVNDHKPVNEQDIVGRVRGYERDGKSETVHNHISGRLRAVLLHTWFSVRLAVKRLFKAPYRVLSQSGLLKKIWRPEITTVGFQTPQGLLIKYLYKNRTVAAHWIDRDKWICRPPFALILDQHKPFNG